MVGVRSYPETIAARDMSVAAGLTSMTRQTSMEIFSWRRLVRDHHAQRPAPASRIPPRDSENAPLLARPASLTRSLGHVGCFEVEDRVRQRHGVAITLARTSARTFRRARSPFSGPLHILAEVTSTSVSQKPVAGESAAAVRSALNRQPQGKSAALASPSGFLSARVNTVVFGCSRKESDLGASPPYRHSFRGRARGVHGCATSFERSSFGGRGL